MTNLDEALIEMLRRARPIEASPELPMAPDAFRMMRENAGYNQAEAGAAMGVSRVTIVRWETGKMPITRRAAAGLNGLYMVKSREVRAHERFVSPVVVTSATGSMRRRSIPAAIKRAVIARDGGVCVYCGAKPDRIFLDHRMPVSRGGEHSEANLCVSCHRCNSAKRTRTAEEFIRYAAR